jgi:hypothetical protein
MGKSMYKFGKQTKEKARQQKQIEKASKRLAAKQQKVHGEPSIDSAVLPANEPGLTDDVEGTA